MSLERSVSHVNESVMIGDSSSFHGHVLMDKNI